MRLVDITVTRTLADPPDLAALTDEQRAAVNAWLERTAAEFMLQAMGYQGTTRIWIDEHGAMQIEHVDTLAASAGAHPPATPPGAEPAAGRADPAPMFPNRLFAYCGN